MMQRLSCWVLALYPQAWRDRYGAELRALIDERPPSTGTLVDLLRGALDAHVHPGGLTGSPRRRMRGTLSATLSCWVGLALLGAGFAKATEDPPFRGAGDAHALLGDAWLLVAALALAGAAVLALSGAPLAFTILREAWCERKPRLVLPLLAALMALGGFALMTALVSAVAGRTHGPTLLGRGLFLLWVGAAVVVAAGCALTARAGLTHARVPGWQLVVGVAGAWLLARIMAALTIAVAIYVVVLMIDSPSLAASPNGPFNWPTTVVIASQLVGMLLMSALAALTTRRGLAALRD